MYQQQIDFNTVRFNGSDYSPEKDNQRLGTQYMKIFELMKDGKYRTLEEIKTITGYPESSISAQLRHMRKPRFGCHTILKNVRGNRENGLFEYKLIVNEKPYTAMQGN